MSVDVSNLFFSLPFSTQLQQLIRKNIYDHTSKKGSHARYTIKQIKPPPLPSPPVAFFGDGTCNIGQFYECLNMAALWKLPMIFVVENNLWAIGMNHFRSTSVPEIYQKGPAFGVPGVHVDGMDVMAVRGVAMEAIARARRGDGPTLIEAETYRFRGHSLADPDELRDPGEHLLRCNFWDATFGMYSFCVLGSRPCLMSLIERCGVMVGRMGP